MEKNDRTSYIENLDDPSRLREIYFGLAPEGRKEMVTALTSVRDERAGICFVALLAGETDKELQKLIRKALFRLKTVGIRVEEPRPAGEPALKAIEDKKEHKAFMSNYDQENTRIVILAFEVKKNYYIFVNAMLHLYDGLTDLKLAPLARSEFEAIIAEYRDATDRLSVLVEISPAYAARLIGEGEALSHRHEEDVRQIKQFALNLKTGVQRPRDLYELQIPDDITPLPVSEVLSDDLFHSFSLAWDTMEADKEVLASATGSNILLPPQVMTEKLETFLTELIETEPLKAKLPFLTRLIEDYAYIYYLSGRYDSFMTLMELLKHEKGPRGALAFFISKTLESKENRAEPRQELIVNPYE